MKKYFVCIILALFLSAPLAASAASTASGPLETVKVNVDKVLNVLRDPALQGASAVTKKKEALRRISNDLFNWPLLSRMVLARNWRALTPAQQQEFINLFKEILEKAYINKILAYKDEKIEYVSNKMLTERKAEVDTHIVSNTSPVDLTYRLALVDGKWGVYDIIVEGVSLTANYRDQFRDFLYKNTPVQLLDHLKEKVGDH